MLIRLSFAPKPFVFSVCLFTMAFVLLNVPVFAADSTRDAGMAVLSMDEMETLAGGSYRSKNPQPSIPANCGSWCLSCADVAYNVFSTCFCNGSTSVPYCVEQARGVAWSKYKCGCALTGCSTKYYLGRGGTRYKCVT